MGQENKSETEEMIMPTADVSLPVKDFSNQDFEIPTPDTNVQDDAVEPISK